MRFLNWKFPFLVKNGQYKFHIDKLLKVDQMWDMVNSSDDQPELLFSRVIDRNLEDSEVPPFFLHLWMHDFILHNAMLDSRASHNLMPKAILDKLGLDITWSYHDLYSFDSRIVKCLGLIKDFIVSLNHIPSKNLLLDVVFIDIPPNYGMILSRSWEGKLKGTF